MPIQQGIEGADGRFLRADGSIPLTANWDAGDQIITSDRIMADNGGLIGLGEHGAILRLRYFNDEVIRIVGVSNNEAEFLQKNATMTDLAGVGVRAVMADVNGKLSAP